MDIKEVETVNDLRAWVTENLAPAKVEIDTNGEVVIMTGMTVEMNGVLYPLEWDSEDSQ